MKLKHQIVAMLIALTAISPVMAANQTVQLTLNPLVDTDNKFYSVTAPGDGVLSDGEDTLWFTGLKYGKYNISIGIVGQNLVFDSLATELNGAKGVVWGVDKISFFGVNTWGDGSFTLNLVGTALEGALYSGNVTISAVPEPETYTMLLGGMAMLGIAARRRKIK
jgi:hypothetical protein